MKKLNLICASLGFLVVLISTYFGASIYNASATNIVSYLNEMDHIHYYDPKLIPLLTHKAAVFTFPFLLALLSIQVFIAFKSFIKQVKNFAIGLSIAAGIVLTVSVLIFINPSNYDFSIWGYIYITMGMLIVAGNLISSFIKGNA